MGKTIRVRFGDTFANKLSAFTALVESESNARHRAQFGPHFQNEKVCYSEDGNKYVRIFFDNGVQKMSRYFVEVKTGRIFACEGWKKPNLKRSFGTLETMGEFEWGGYEGYAKPDSQFTMKTTVGPYATAVLEECRRCGSTVKGDRCTDVTCPYSDYPQSDNRFAGPTD